MHATPGSMVGTDSGFMNRIPSSEDPFAEFEDGPEGQEVGDGEEDQYGATQEMGGTPPRTSSLVHVSSRVDRLLQARFRKTQSTASLAKLAEEHQPAYSQLPRPPSPSSQRLLIIANRLPVTIRRDAGGNGWELTKSAGGLVSALLGVGSFQIKWIGWPGQLVDSHDQHSLARTLARDSLYPVFLDQETMNLYYNGFCNSILWNLFHYVPLTMDSKLTGTKTMQLQWEAYKRANRAFCQVVLDEYQDGDVVWCHDYHVMLLPLMLKEARPEMKLGWFLHTPFPSSEIYRALPLREEILRGVLAADLVGFHTYDYARHFVSACTRILGLEGTPEGVEDNGNLTRVAAFPIGIDPEQFMHALRKEDVRANIMELRERFKGRRVMLGVDRLDMIKGIPQKLLSIEKFLDEHPEWHDNVIVIQIAVPTRTEVPEYQALRSTVHEIVGRINGKFGTLTTVPIHHLDRQLSFDELVALYAVTDVALVSSLRDGMNLVAYEYVACQMNRAGVLILSEFAGAAQSLGAGALLVNPYNINDTAQAIEYALTMSDDERRDRHKQNYQHVMNHTAQAWAETFISELNDTHVEHQLRAMKVPPPLEIPHCWAAFRGSQKKLLILGFNAALTSTIEAPTQPKRHFDQLKSYTRLHPDVTRSIEVLSRDPSNIVCVFSGSGKQKMVDTFGHLPVWLVAENGVYVRPPAPPAPGGSASSSPSRTSRERPHEKNGGWVQTITDFTTDWMEAYIREVFRYFCERTPRSFVECRETSIVWNYKHADVEFGRLQARDLLQHLWTGPISNAPVDVVQGAKSVEVRPVGVTKGGCLAKILRIMAENEGSAQLDIDFVMCVGHFLQRDEDIFLIFEGRGAVAQHHAPPEQPLHRPSVQDPRRGSRMSNASAVGSGGAPGDGSPQPGSLKEGLTIAQPPAAAGASKGDVHRAMSASVLAEGGGPAPPASPGGRHVQGGDWRLSRQNSAKAAANARAAAGRARQAPVQRAATGPPTNVPLHPADWRRVTYDPASANRRKSDAVPDNAELPQRAHAPGMGERFPREPVRSRLEVPAAPIAHVPPRHLFTCTVGRQRSNARYLLNGSSEVASLLQVLAGLQEPFHVAPMGGRRMGRGSLELGRPGASRVSLDMIQEAGVPNAMHHCLSSSLFATDAQSPAVGRARSGALSPQTGADMQGWEQLTRY
ncbi:unnamed protein product [Pedinophyceae sp. YPF-701]|nr:unnamed protein product [Pedinophyceae sp. YPF-701]